MAAAARGSFSVTVNSNADLRNDTPSCHLTVRRGRGANPPPWTASEPRVCSADSDSLWRAVQNVITEPENRAREASRDRGPEVVIKSRRDAPKDVFVFSFIAICFSKPLIARRSLWKPYKER